MEEPITSLSGLEQLNSDLDNIFSEIKGKEEAYAARIKLLEQQLADKDSDGEIARILLTLKEARVQCAALQSRLTAAENEKEDCKQAALKAQAALTGMSAPADKNESGKVAQLCAALKAETNNHAEVLARYKGACSRADALEADAAWLAAENALLKERGQAADAAGRKAIDELERKLKSREAELDMARAALGALEKEYDARFEGGKEL